MTMQWQPDILGSEFEQLTLELPQGAIATLVRHVHDSTSSGELDADVLYVHGWSDYFFQVAHANFWDDMGASFYALDLRNYGRSLRSGLQPGHIVSLESYDEEIDAALTAMGRSDNSERPLILVGHSAGGLTLSLWAGRHPGVASALILNSPWLEFQAAGLGRMAIAEFLDIESKRHPLTELPPVDHGIYTRTISSAFEGEWTYDFDWRPERGFAVTSGFLHAVFAGHKLVAAGLDIDCPVLVLLSRRSYLEPHWSEHARRSDVAIHVDGVARRALSLGNAVSIVRVDEALHDVFLSRDVVRAQAYAEIDRWLTGYAPS